jgi:hypothetical protein
MSKHSIETNPIDASWLLLLLTMICCCFSMTDFIFVVTPASKVVREYDTPRYRGVGILDNFGSC